MEKEKVYKTIRTWLPGLLISLVAFKILFDMTDWHTMIKAFSTMRPIFYIVCILVSIVGICTRAFAWKALLNGKASLLSIFNTLNIGSLLNNILPLRMGEIAKVFLFGKISDNNAISVIPAILIERVCDIAIAASLFLVTLPFVLEMNWARPASVMMLVLIIIGLVILFIAAHHKTQIINWLETTGNRFSFVSRFLIPKVSLLLDGLEMMRQPGLFLKCFFWLLITWFIYTISYWVIVYLQIPGLPLWSMPFLLSVVALGMALPSAPGGIGVYEASLVGALTLLGVSTETSLAIGLSLHFINFLMFAVLGLIGLTRERYSIGEMIH